MHAQRGKGSTYSGDSVVARFSALSGGYACGYFGFLRNALSLFEGTDVMVI
jgi:hypothetical protein